MVFHHDGDEGDDVDGPCFLQYVDFYMWFEFHHDGDEGDDVDCPCFCAMSISTT